MIIVRKTPSRENKANSVPRISSYAKNSIALGMQASLCLLDQYTGGHFIQCTESAKEKEYREM